MTNKKGQATIEVVLLLPLFIIFILIVIRIFAMLSLKQKMEIATLYAARRWQLESHVDVRHAPYDKNILYKNIQKKVDTLIGLDKPAAKKFMDITAVELTINPSVNWREVDLTVYIKPPRLGILCKYDKQIVCKHQPRPRNYQKFCYLGYNYICGSGGKMSVKKVVSLKPRTYEWELPSPPESAKANGKIFGRSTGSRR